MTTYRLVTGKNGPKLTQSRLVTGPFRRHDSAAPGKRRIRPDADGSGSSSRFRDHEYADVQNTYRLGARNVSMQRLTETFSSTLSRPVSDATGLKGEYDFKLLWAPDFAGVARHQDGSAVPSDPDAESRPTLQRAVQVQLGLSLESSRGQVMNVLVIDHAGEGADGELMLEHDGAGDCSSLSVSLPGL